jgi:hypothetical protein
MLSPTMLLDWLERYNESTMSDDMKCLRNEAGVLICAGNAANDEDNICCRKINRI